MFSRKTITFLKDLSKNNNKEWFNQHKQRYEDEVRSPALAFIESMERPMQKISPHFIVSARKTGGSLMRVHKDIRFSRDKTPYKTNIGIHFKHERGKDVHAPGFYVHIEPGEVFLGVGIWRPESSTLRNVRMQIDDHPAEWKKLSKKIQGTAGFTFGGESLKRPPKGFAAEHPLIEDLKRKDFIAVKTLKVSDATAKTFSADVARLFKSGSPLVQFICESDDLTF
ncbi:MAG: DUF2461 domain-containing protein [Gammaproteobacteria bacterium]|nr:DUF2461 domain-containing protein [Gammaproteobacteria bacterium]